MNGLNLIVMLGFILAGLAVAPILGVIGWIMYRIFTM